MPCPSCADGASSGWPLRFHLYPDGMFSHVPGSMPRAGEGEGTVAFTWGGRMGCEEFGPSLAGRDWPSFHDLLDCDLAACRLGPAVWPSWRRTCMLGP